MFFTSYTLKYTRPFNTCDDIDNWRLDELCCQTTYRFMRSRVVRFSTLETTEKNGNKKSISDVAVDSRISLN